MYLSYFYRFLLLTSFLTAFCTFSFAETKYFPYETKIQKEFFLLFSGYLLYTAGDFSIKKIPDPINVSHNKSQINVLDRFAADCYSKDADKLSEYTSKTAIYIPALTTLVLLETDRESFISNCFNIGVMYFETSLITSGLTNIAKGSFRRYRPYCYNKNVSDSKKLEPGCHQSMWSGHTSSAFAGAVFAGNIMNELLPSSRPTRLVWITGITASAATAYLRVQSGRHFPSDVLAGAAAGSLTGWIIPEIHKRKTNITLYPFKENGICLNISF